MKKLLNIILLSVAVLLLLVFVLLPAEMRINKSITIRQNAAAVSRAFSEKQKWQQWWTPDAFTYYPENFSAQAQMVGRFRLGNENGLAANIQLVDLGIDSTLLVCEAALPRTNNPYTRLQYFFGRMQLEKQLEQQISSVKQFAEKDANVYGMNIAQVKVMDSVLISVRQQFAAVPATNEIYEMINGLKQYLKSQGAMEANHPMLHMEQRSKGYDVMVAIPLNKSIAETDRYRIKRMVLGNILEAEVRGGPGTVRQAMLELEHYRTDHKKISPAIPFELLVTDRSMEPDSTKWITRLYYPVI